MNQSSEPTRVAAAVTVTIVDHPLVVDALAQIRDRSTPNALFRQNLERIGTLLMARATESLPTIDTTVETPLTTAPARRLAVQPIVVPILRAGLGFVHAAQELLPDADVGFVGISRDEETFAPKPYVNKLPESLAGRPVIVVDPMLATGGSLVHTVELLAGAGRPDADHGGLRAVRARRASSGCATPTSRCTSSRRRSTTTSTTPPSSSPASATPATANSAPPPETRFSSVFSRHQRTRKCQENWRFRSRQA